MRNFPSHRAGTGFEAIQPRAIQTSRANARLARLHGAAPDARAIRFTDWALI